MLALPGECHDIANFGWSHYAIKGQGKKLTSHNKIVHLNKMAFSNVMIYAIHRPNHYPEVSNKIIKLGKQLKLSVVDGKTLVSRITVSRITVFPSQ